MAFDFAVPAPRSDRSELLAAIAAARSRVGVVAVVLTLAGLAWWSTIDRMAGMDAGPGTNPGTVGWFIGVWVVMMAAMMLPSLAPTAAVYASVSGRREPTRPLLFVGGYLLVWGAAGLAAYGLFELGQSTLSGELAWRHGGQWLAVGVLVVAAVYELTPLKDSCLLRCRSPLRFVRQSWREGHTGAAMTGIRAGVVCFGCSWALMAALFALGVMSLTWMGVVAGLVAVQKLGPWRRTAAAATAVVLAVLAVAIVAAPHDVPGLVVPAGPHGAMHAMPGMH